MPGVDWLGALAAATGPLGSYLLTGKVFGSQPDQLGSNLVKGEQAGVQALGTGIGWLSDKDPSKVLSGPILAGLHAAGVGSQGDEWDKGAIGLIGTGFSKVGGLATTAALATAAPSWGGSGWSTLTDSSTWAKSWDMAFDKEAPVDFGAAMMSDGSVLTNPDGLKNLHKELDSTWYGNFVAGSLTFASYAALDPTRGVGKLAKAGNASKFIRDPLQADRVATAVNTADGALADSGKLANAGRALVGQPLNDLSQGGYLMESMGRFHNVTDVNQVMNMMAPKLGEGSTATRLALPTISEMIADAGRITDTVLQAQTKVNIHLALSGSQVSMKWLADNSPMIAAKGRRATGVPSEFTLLRNAMDDIEAQGGITTFDLGQHLDAHYGSAANAAELKAYAGKVADIRRFKDTIEHGAEGGMALDFKTAGSLGTQVAPRTLEVLKGALNQRILNSHLLQDGASGRTMRIVDSSLNKAVTPQARGAISVEDPIMGNKQLLNNLKSFNTKMATPDGVAPFPPEYMQAMSEAYLKGTAADRHVLLEDMNTSMLEKVAEKYNEQSLVHRGFPLTGDDVRQMTQSAANARASHTAYASKRLRASEAAGEIDTYLGELGGSDTVLNTAQLKSQLEGSHFLFDWKTANEAVDSYYTYNRTLPKSTLGRAERFGTSNTAQALNWYLKVWKHNVLMRPGLAVRAILDTGFRSTVSISAATTSMQALNGAYNVARNRGGGILGASDRATMVMSVADKANAARAVDTIAEMRATGAGQAMGVVERTFQADRARELQRSFAAKKRNAPTEATYPVGVLGDALPANRFHSLTSYYRHAEWAADALATRLEGQTRAMTAQFGVDAAARKTSIAGQMEALGRYEKGSLLSKRSIVTDEKMINGRAWRSAQNDMEYAQLKHDLTGGGNTSDVYLGNLAPKLEGMKADFNRGSDHVAPADPRWHVKYAITAGLLRKSYTAKRMMSESESLTRNARTPQAVIDSFLNDAAVEAEFKAVSGLDRVTRADAEAWLSDLANSVQSMIPTETARNLMLGAKEVTPEMVNKTIRGPGAVAAVGEVGDRFPIFGPDVFRDGTRGLVDKFYDTALNLPDMHLARVPQYVGSYRAEVLELSNTYLAAAKKAGKADITDAQAAMIHSRARQRALNAVRRDMYDVHRNVGTHGVMSMISPFFAPWEDAMMSWGRLIYEDPARVGTIMRYSQTADMFHLTVDSNGNEVQPWDGTQMQDKYIQIPLAGVMGLQGMRANLGSLNSIQQGNVPFSPGAGPLVQLSASLLVADILPKLGAPGQAAFKAIAENPDNIVNKSVFSQGGIPKANFTSLITSQMSSYQRKLLDALVGPSGFSFGSVYPSAFGARYGDLITQYRTDNGGRDPSAAELKTMQHQASLGASAAGIASAAFAFGFGISGNAAPEGQLYVDKMHALNQMQGELARQGLTPGGVFAVMYPNAARLNWNFSVNDGHLQATVNATSAYYKHKALIDSSGGKDVSWWIAGADNLLANLGDPDSTTGNTFSQSAYNQQMNAGLRRRFNKEDLVKEQDIAMGYGRMAAYDSALALYMRQNGIKSLSSKNAGQLSVGKAQYVAALSDQFPEWANEVNTYNRKAKELQIAHIQTIVENPPPGLKDRPDVVTTTKYLAMRDLLAKHAAEQGVTSWQTSKQFLPDRFTLWKFGQSLAAGDIVFQQAWSRLFETEFKGDLTPTMGT